MDDELLKRLKEPDCYPGRPRDVVLRQTHMSVVCLAGDRVYKLKKPVKFPFADFSTAELRERICRDELRLNRRLCHDIYLDVVPLRRDPGGTWSFGESAGEIVDHAILMKRLPEDRLMDRLLERDEVTAGQVRAVAQIMARFHRESPDEAAVREAGAPKRVCEAIRENFATAREFVGGVFDGELLSATEKASRREIERRLPLLRERSRAGRIVEGHGDLHSRNICLTDPPTIFDCLEFRRDFRCGDIAVENAFLVMDLVFRGHPELAREYLRAYLAVNPDPQHRELMPLMVSYRAMVRAKVAALAADDDGMDVQAREHSRDSAARHLQLAAASLGGVKPRVILLCGLPGTGKSTLADKLSRAAGWSHLASDSIRKELAGVKATDRLPEEGYAPSFSRRVYGELIRRGVAALADGPVLLDANFPSRESRAQAAVAARRAGAETVILWLNPDEGTVQDRLRRRVASDIAVSDAGPSVYERLRLEFEPPDPAAGIPVIVLGQEDSPKALDRALRGLLA